MATYDQAIANLRQSNRLSIAQIKTYTADEARFQSANLQRQGQLWMLAGELGANITAKIQAHREKSAINEEYISYYEDKWKEYENSEEALIAENSFKNNANNQNILSDNLTKLDNDGAPSEDIHEAKLSSGKHIRLREQLKTADLAQRYSGWLNNQLLNNDTIFFAEIDGKMTKLKVNDPNLTFRQKVAAQKYLTKEYFNLHDIQKYSRDFLYLPKERGGSGFMQSILQSNQAHTQSLKTAYKIELSEHDINLATRNLATTKDPQSFKDLLAALNAGYDAKGKPLNYAGAWKRLNDKILPQMIDAGLLPPDEILKLGQNTTLNINGKEVILGEHRSLEWGENGKWHRKALDVWSNKGENAKKKNDFKLASAAKEFIKNIKNDTFTSKTDIQRARAVLEKLNQEGSGDFDFTEIDNLLDSDLTKEQADTKALEILKKYNESAEGLKLSELIKSEDVLVQQSPILTKALKDEIKFLKELEASLKGEKKNYASESKDLSGLSVWQFNNAPAQERWNLIEGYAIRLKRDFPNERPAQIWKETQAWIKENTVEISTPADQWDDYANTLEGDELAEFNEKRSKLFAKDSEGDFPNVLPEVEFNRSSKVSKEDKLEIDSAKTVKINPEIKFTNPKTIIPEEKAVFKNQDIDYNKMLDDIGYIPDSIVDLASYWGLTTADFIKYRQQANGKKDLKPEYARYLNEKEVSTLPSAMKNRLLGKIDDGQYTPESTSATVARNSSLAGGPIVISFGANGEDFVQAIGDTYKLFGDSINDDGDFTFDGDSGKTLFGLYTGIGMSLDSKVFNDFVPGGANLFVEAINQNLSQKDIASMATLPEFGFNAYSASGNIDFLPVVDMLQESKGQENLNKILEKLNKYWYTPKDEMTDDTSEDDNTSGKTTDSTKIIDETLNTK